MASVEKHRYIELALSTTAALGLLAVALSAFPKRVRKEIFDRDGGKSARSGKEGWLHAAHIDHTRDEDYTNPENGRMLTVLEHYEDHYDRHGRNGLSERGNIAALRLLWHQLSDGEQAALYSPDTL